jgi:hypothetical protein
MSWREQSERKGTYVTVFHHALVSVRRERGRRVRLDAMSVTVGNILELHRVSTVIGDILQLDRRLRKETLISIDACCLPIIKCLQREKLASL